MLTVTVVLLLAAFVVTIGSTWNPPRAPLWAAVLLLTVAALLQVVPK